MFNELRKAVGRDISVHVNSDTDVLGLAPTSVAISVNEVLSCLNELLKPRTGRDAELPYEAEGKCKLEFAPIDEAIVVVSKVVRLGAIAARVVMLVGFGDTG